MRWCGHLHHRSICHAMKFSEFFNIIVQTENLSKLERWADLPTRTLHKYNAHIRGKRGGSQLPQKHIAAIIRALCEARGVLNIDKLKITISLRSDDVFIVESDYYIRTLTDSTISSIFDPE